MEVQAHARCKPCHTSYLSSFLSCWTMPGLHRKAREGGGQGAEEERRWQQDTRGGGWWSQLWVGTASSSCLRGAVPGGAALCPPWAGAGGTVPSLEQRAWLGSGPALPRPLLPSLPRSLLPQLQSQHFRTVTASRAAPRGAGAATPVLFLLLSPPVVTAPSQSQATPARLFLSLAGGTVAVASSCTGSDFVGEVC